MVHREIFRLSITNKARELAKRYGYLPYMVQRYYEIFKDWNEVILFLKGNERPILKSIRCNTLRIDCSKLEDKLNSKNIVLEKIQWLPHGYWVYKSPISIGATHEYLRGYYHIQGPASMIPPLVLDPKPDELVLDMAAAPGGKTTYMAQLMNNKGIIVAVDKSRERIKSLLSNINRLGVINTITIRTNAIRLNEILDMKFKKILLDAPCTGEGLIPLIPERKTSRTINDIKKLTRLQILLLKTALDLLEDNGILVYSTCSIAPEENEYVILRVLEKYKNSNIELLPININIGTSGLEEYKNIHFGKEFKRCKRLYPYIHGTEGFFIAKLRKKR